jgi:hypothetical protein
VPKKSTAPKIASTRPAAPEPPASAPPASPDRWTDGWRAGEGLAVPGEGTASPRRGGLSTALQGEQMGQALGIGPAQPDELPRAEAIGPESDEVVKKRITGRIEGFAKSFNAHERARFPDVYWRNLRDEMAKSFDVPYEVYEQGGGGGRVGALARQYQRDAANYGQTGAPFAAPPRSLQADTALQGSLDRGLPESALQQVEVLQRSVGAAGGRKLVAHILVSQKDDGTLADVSLMDGSGNAAYDRLALKQARSLLGKELSRLGPLPHDGRKSLWAFESDFLVVPPLPLAGCALDPFFIPRDCMYPLQKRARSSIRLEAIY